MRDDGYGDSGYRRDEYRDDGFVDDAARWTGDKASSYLDSSVPNHLLMAVGQVQEVEDIPEDAARWTGDKVCSHIDTAFNDPC